VAKKVEKESAKKGGKNAAPPAKNKAKAGKKKK
jgi:hypothetical protein